MLRAIVPEVTVFQPDFILSSGKVDLGSFAQSITIQKSVRSAVGTCQITFNPVLNIQSNINLSDVQAPTYFRRILKKNTVIAVKIDSRQISYDFLGFIDHVPERITANNRATGHSITINCSMLLPKMLVRDNIINSPALGALKEVKLDPVLKERSEFFTWVRGADKESPFTGTPEKAVKYILNNAPATNSAVVVIAGRDYSVQTFVGDGEDYTGQKTRDFQFLKREFLYDPALSSYAGTILNYLWECLDKEFYEIYFDATSDGDRQPVAKIVIRPKPFTHKAFDPANLDGWTFWEDLPIHVINSQTRLEETLGQSDFELKNVFQVFFQRDIIANAQSHIAKYGYQFPIINIESVKKYGLRDLTVHSRIANFEVPYKALKDKTKEDGADFSKLLDVELKDPLLNKRNKIMYWHGFPHYESGQITLIGGDYKIGNRLYYEDRQYYDEENDKFIKGVEYYIDQTSQRYTYPQTYTTTLSVSRGAPTGFVPEWFAKNGSKFIKIDTLQDPPASKIPQDEKSAREIRDKIFEEITGVKIIEQ